jgi:hypothetical protein
MDGTVNFFDITQLLGYKYNTGQAASYTDGDLNYDGVVDFFDITTLLSANYNTGETFTGSLPPTAAAAPSAITPEPTGTTSALLMALTAMPAGSAARPGRGSAYRAHTPATNAYPK